MIGSLPQSNAKAPPSLKSLLSWGAIGLVLTALLVSSVCDMNRMGLIMLITLPMLTLVVINVEFGIYCLLTYSSVLAFLIRMMPPGNTGPLGIALDILLLLMGMRLAFDLWRKRDWKIFTSPMTTPILAFVAFQCVEVFNPAAPSIVFGLWGLRVTIRMLGFFLVLYYFRQRASIKRLMWVWLTTMALVGCYGIFQHHHGLLWQEMNWLLTEGNATTHILHGYVRVFSTVGDASTFGFLMIFSSLIMFALALNAKGLNQLLLIAGTLPMLYGCVVSYSRGPIVALVFGAAVMVVVSRNWKLAIGMAATGFLGLVLLTASGSTMLVDRLSTATNPTEDASYNVRMGYITQYLPEIAKRPFGYGINSSGQSGLKASGGEKVRNGVVGVPTDNYYFKTALEMGWVGLLLFLWLNLAAIFYAYKVYLRTQDPYYKALALGILSVLVSLFVGAFSNDINSQKPISEFFWIMLGLSMLIGQHQPRAQQLYLPAPRTPLMLPPGRAS